jgi:hypothetical protein
MIARQQLSLEEITDQYYSIDLHKIDNQLILTFDTVQLVFENCLIVKCGYPNEEVYMHYDYYTLGGMKKHCLYQLEDSSWIRELVNINKVHARHIDKMFRT